MVANQLIVGLTGGIASGKTAVSDSFKELGVDIIDADVIARDVVMPGSSGLKSVVNEFGAEILKNDALDRRALRKIVFNDESKLNLLNSILHPLIREQITDQIKLSSGPYCIVVIPLLCESKEYDWLHRVLVVDVKPEIQIERLIKRDNITKELAEKMLAQQCSRPQRLKIANDVIKNEAGIPEMKDKVKLLHCAYKQWSKSSEN